MPNTSIVFPRIPMVGSEQDVEGSHDSQHEVTREEPLRVKSVDAQLQKALQKMETPHCSDGAEMVQWFLKHRHETNAPIFAVLGYADDGTNGNMFELEAITSIRPPRSHFVVSHTGITRIDDGKQAETLGLKQWLRLREQFLKLRKIPFFGRHTESKVFNHFRRAIRLETFELARKHVAANLLFLQDGCQQLLFRAQQQLCDLLHPECGSTNTVSKLLGERLDEQPKSYSERKKAHEHALNHAHERLTTTTEDLCNQMREFADATLPRDINQQNEPLSLRDLRRQHFEALPERWAPKSFNPQILAQEKRLQERDDHVNRLLLIARVSRLLDLLLNEHALEALDMILRSFLNSLKHPRGGGELNIKGKLPTHREQECPFLDPQSSEAQDLFLSYFESCKGVMSSVVRPLQFQRLWQVMQACEYGNGVCSTAKLLDTSNYQSLQREAKALVEHDFKRVWHSEAYKAFESVYEVLQFLHAWDVKAYWAQKPSPEEFRNDLRFVEYWRDCIEGAEVIHVGGLFSLNMSDIRSQLQPMIATCLSEMKDLVVNVHITHCSDIERQLQSAIEALERKLDDLKGFVEYIRLVQQHSQTHESSGQQLSKAMEMHRAFVHREMEMSIAYDDTLRVHSSTTSLERVYEDYVSSLRQGQRFCSDASILSMYRARWKSEVQLLERWINSVMETMNSTADVDINEGEPSRIVPYLKDAIESELVQCESRMSELDSWSQTLKTERSLLPFEASRSLRESLDAWKEVWIEISKWNSFVLRLRNTSVQNRASLAESELHNALYSLYQAKGILRVHENAKVLQSLNEMLEIWEHPTRLNVYNHLCEGYLKDVHWRQLLGEEAANLPVENALTSAHEDSAKFERVLTRALQGSEVSSQLASIQKEVENLEFHFEHEQWRDLNRLANYNELVVTLQENQQRLQQLATSALFDETIEQFLQLERFLEDVESLLRAFKRAEEQWVFLAKLFSIRRVRAELENESEQFEAVHSQWASLLNQMCQEKDLKTCARIDGSLRRVGEVLENLCAIRFQATRCTPAMRSENPRLYLLSDEEILQLCTSGLFLQELPQCLISKVFPGVRRLKFQTREESPEKIGVDGVEAFNGETVKFDAPIGPSVEQGPAKMVTLLESVLTESLHQSIKSSMRRCGYMRMDDWLKSFPCQALVLTDAVAFCNIVDQVRDSTDAPNEDSMQHLFSRLAKKVESWKRELHSNTSSRIALGALISAAVAQREVVDVLKQELRQLATNEAAAEVWRSLWYDTTKICWYDSGEEASCWLSIGNSVVPYGYEYLGDAELIHNAAEIFQFSYSASILSETLCVDGICSTTGAEAASLAKSLACASGKLFFEANLLYSISSLRHLYVALESLNAITALRDADSLSRELVSHLASDINQRRFHLLNKGDDDRQRVCHNGVVLCYSDGMRSLRSRAKDPLNDLSLQKQTAYLSSIGAAGTVPTELRGKYRALYMIEPRNSAVIEADLSRYGVANPGLAASRIALFLNHIRTIFETQHHYVFNLTMLRRSLYQQLSVLSMSDLSADYKWYYLKTALHVHFDYMLLPGDRDALRECLISFFCPYDEADSIPCELLRNRVAPENHATTEKMSRMSLRVADTMRFARSVLVLGSSGVGKSSVIASGINILSKFQCYDYRVERLYPESLSVDEIKLESSKWSITDQSERYRHLTISSRYADILILDGMKSVTMANGLRSLIDKETADGENISRVILEANQANDLDPSILSSCQLLYIGSEECFDVLESRRKAAYDILAELHDQTHFNVEAALEVVGDCICSFNTNSNRTASQCSILNNIVDGTISFMKAFGECLSARACEISLLLCAAWMIGSKFDREGKQRVELKLLKAWREMASENKSTFSESDFEKEIDSLTSIFDAWLDFENVQFSQPSNTERIPQNLWTRSNNMLYELINITKVNVVLFGGTETGRRQLASSCAEFMTGHQGISINLCEGNNTSFYARSKICKQLHRCGPAKLTANHEKGVILTVHDLHLAGGQGQIIEALRQIIDSSSVTCSTFRGELQTLELDATQVISTCDAFFADNLKFSFSRFAKKYTFVNVDDFCSMETLFLNLSNTCTNSLAEEHVAANVVTYKRFLEDVLDVSLQQSEILSGIPVEALFGKACKLFLHNQEVQKEPRFLHEIVTILFDDVIGSEHEALRFNDAVLNLLSDEEEQYQNSAALKHICHEDGNPSHPYWLDCAAQQLELSSEALNFVKTAAVKLHRHIYTIGSEVIAYACQNSYRAHLAAKILSCIMDRQIHVLEASGNIQDQLNLTPAHACVFVDSNICDDPQKAAALQEALEPKCNGSPGSILILHTETGEFQSLARRLPMLTQRASFVQCDVLSHRTLKQRCFNILTEFHVSTYVTESLTDIVEACIALDTQTNLQEEGCLRFCELLASNLVSQCRSLDAQINHYKTGLESCNDADNEFQQLLEAKKESSQRQAGFIEETTTTLSALSTVEAEVQELKARIAEEEDDIKEMRSRVRSARDAVSSRMQKAKQNYETVLEALPELRASISELRLYVNPPRLVQAVMEATLVALGYAASWPKAMTMLAEADPEQHLYYKVLNHDPSQMSDEQVRAVSRYACHDFFSPEQVQNFSSASRLLCEWVIATFELGRASCERRKREESISAAQTKVNYAIEGVHQKKQKLHEKEQDLENYREAYQKAQRGRDSEVDESNRLTRLVDALDKHLKYLTQARSSWSSRLQEKQVQRASVLPDSFKAAAILNYGSNFGMKEREDLIANAEDTLLGNGLSKGRSFTRVDGEKGQLLQYLRERLPKGFWADKLETGLHTKDSLIIAQYCSGLPLLLDEAVDAMQCLQKAYSDSSWEMLTGMSHSTVLEEEVSVALSAGVNVLVDLDSLEAPMDVLERLVTMHKKRERSSFGTCLYASCSRIPPELEKMNENGFCIIKMERTEAERNHSIYEAVDHRLCPRENARVWRARRSIAKDSRGLEHAHERILNHLSQSSRSICDDEALQRACMRSASVLDSTSQQLLENQEELESAQELLQEKVGHLRAAAVAAYDALLEHNNLSRDLSSFTRHLLRPSLEDEVLSLRIDDVEEVQRPWYEAMALLGGIAANLAPRLHHGACLWYATCARMRYEEIINLVGRDERLKAIDAMCTMLSTLDMKDRNMFSSKTCDSYEGETLTAVHAILNCQSIDQFEMPNVANMLSPKAKFAKGIHPSHGVTPPLDWIAELLRFNSGVIVVTHDGQTDDPASLCCDALVAAGIEDVEFVSNESAAVNAADHGATPVVLSAENLALCGFRLARRLQSSNRKPQPSALLCMSRSEFSEPATMLPTIDMRCAGGRESELQALSRRVHVRLASDDPHLAYRLAEQHLRICSLLWRYGFCTAATAESWDVPSELLLAGERGPKRLARRGYTTFNDPQAEHLVRECIGKALGHSSMPMAPQNSMLEAQLKSTVLKVPLTRHALEADIWSHLTSGDATIDEDVQELFTHLKTYTKKLGSCIRRVLLAEARRILMYCNIVSKDWLSTHILELTRAAECQNVRTYALHRPAALTSAVIIEHCKRTGANALLHTCQVRLQTPEVGAGAENFCMALNQVSVWSVQSTIGRVCNAVLVPTQERSDGVKIPMLTTLQSVHGEAGEHLWCIGAATPGKADQEFWRVEAHAAYP